MPQLTFSLLLACLTSLFFSLSLAAQTPTPSPSPTPIPTPVPIPTIPAGTADEKSQQLINHAIEVLGGQDYLKVQSVIGRGFFTPFSEGVSQLPSKFVDYIVYPDRERTEFNSAGIKTIQTNSGNTGWIYDGGPKTIKDQGPAQVDDFKRGLKTGIENLLRGWWQKDSGRVVYVGRRQAGLAKRNETIRLVYPDGFWIEYEFGAKDGLPAKVIYLRSRKNMDTGDTEAMTEEDYLLKPITVTGVTAPWVVDHYVNGRQTSRINYESIQYNQSIPDSIFAKPDNVKSLK